MLNKRLRPVSLLCLVLCCPLAGCGGGSSFAPSTYTAVAAARSLTLSFTVNNLSTENSGGYYLFSEPLDETKPVIVTIGGVPQVQGKDYSFDPLSSHLLHFNNTIYLPYATPVVVQYTSLPTITQQFMVTKDTQTTLTFARPADLTLDHSALLVIRGGGNTDSTSADPLPSQDYTLTAGPPTVLRLTRIERLPETIQVTYVPKT